MGDMTTEQLHELLAVAPGVLHFGGARMALFEIEHGFWGLRRQLESLTGPRLATAVLQQAGAAGAVAFARSFAPDVTPATALVALCECIAAYSAAGFGRFAVEAGGDLLAGQVHVTGQDGLEAWGAMRRGQRAELPVCAYTAGVLAGFANALTGREDIVVVEHDCQARGADACRFELRAADGNTAGAVAALTADPYLGHQFGLLELLFDRMPMGIGVLDRDLTIRRINPTLVRFIAETSRIPAAAIGPGQRFFALAPDIEPLLGPIFARVLAGESFRHDGLRLETGGIVSYWDVAYMPIRDGNAVTGILTVVTDANDRVTAEQQLREKEQQYRGIFEATGDGLVITDLDSGLVLEANPAFCRMHGYSYEEMINRDPRTFISEADHHLFVAYIDAVRAGKNFDARAVDIRKDGSRFHVEVHGTPFVYKGRPCVLGVVRDISERMRDYELLEQHIAERTRELSGLLAISRSISVTMELEPLLNLLLDQLAGVVEFSGAAIIALDNEELCVLASRWQGQSQPEVVGQRFPLGPAVALWRMFRGQDAAIIDDVSIDSAQRRAFRAMLGDRADDEPYRYFRSWMNVAMIVKDRAVGTLSLASTKPNHYTPEHARIVRAFASQAAIAIENARLYEQAQQVAALEERQRLARELHDSVTQSLFSITMMSGAIPRLFERNPARALEQVERLNDLARGAHAEMRALIYELRPESLEVEGLVAALEKHVTALGLRHQLAVTLDLCPEEPQVPLDVKHDLYRIAREALHNTIKHAGATGIEVRLTDEGGALVLEVGDNGRGFDPAADYTGHLGLRSMRERVTLRGGRLTISSAPGDGTRIRATMPA